MTRTGSRGGGDFLVYHNPESIGYSAREVEVLEIVTDKQVSREVIGGRVWLLTGEGKPTHVLLARAVHDRRCRVRRRGRVPSAG
jgi:hypothetical protein